MKKSLLLCMAIIFSAQLAFAHDGEHHYGESINKEEAIIAASEGINAVISQGIEIKGIELDESWGDIPLADKSIVKETDSYYIVSLKNAKQDKTIYVLLSDKGEFYDANYSGEFSGLQ